MHPHLYALGQQVS